MTNLSTTIAKVGIYDSGRGGYLIWRCLKQLYPCIQWILYQDHAGFPYGDKTNQAVIARGRVVVEQLIDQQVSLIIFACYTASVIALPTLKHEFPIEMFAISSYSSWFINSSSCTDIIWLATEASIQAMRDVNKSSQINGTHIIPVACPDWVRLIENQTTDDMLVRKSIVNKVDAIISHINRQDRDSSTIGLFLGCTHFFDWEAKFYQFYGNTCKIINPLNTLISFINQGVVSYLNNNIVEAEELSHD